MVAVSGSAAAGIALSAARAEGAISNAKAIAGQIPAARVMTRRATIQRRMIPLWQRAHDHNRPGALRNPAGRTL
jgi:hypothetical protein